MACQAGVTALTDEANFHQDQAFPRGHCKNRRVSWESHVGLSGTSQVLGRCATLFLHSDNISDSLWKKRNDLPHLTPHVETEYTEQLEQAISKYFYKKEGRGRNCKVEVFRRHEKEYFFAYPEDYAQSGIEWVRNQLSNRSRNPAFEIIFVYTQAEGSLDIYAPRNTKSVPQLQQIFADTILGMDELDEFGGDKRVYVLDALARP